MRCTVLLIINCDPSYHTGWQLHNRLLLSNNHTLYVNLLHHRLLLKRIIVNGCLFHHTLLVKNNLVFLYL